MQGIREEAATRIYAGDNDSEVLRECERELCRMETEETIFRRPVQKRKDRDEDEDDDGFTAVSRRKSKHLLKKDSAEPDRSTNNRSTLEEKHEVCITSRSALPTQMAMARLLKKENIEGVMKIKYKSPFRVFIQFANNASAENLLNCKKFEALDYRCQKTYDKKVTYGMIRGVDLGMEEKEVMSVLECETKILSVKRLKRISSEGAWIDSETIRVCFESLTLPKYAIAYGCRMSVEAFVFPVTRCSGCWKFGHILNFCPTKKPLCPKCGNTNHSNCEITDIKCLNCKGPHFVLDKACPLFMKEKEIRKIMSKENVTYKKALQVLNNMNQQEDQDVEADIIGEPKEPENRTKNNMTFDAAARSYRNVLISAEVHKGLDSYVSEEETEETFPQKYKRKKETFKKKTIPKTKHNKKDNDGDIIADDSSDETGIKSQNEKTDRKFDFKELLHKIRRIIFAKESLESKVVSVFALIFEECKAFLTNFVSGANLFEKLLSLMYNSKLYI